jgi:hypothetical protein
MALALALGAAAQAAEPRSVVVDGQAVRLPVPEGFCLPTGPYEVGARQMAAFDEDNVTLLTLNSCSQMAAKARRMTHYVHVKFPVSARGLTVTMADVHREFPDAPDVFARWFDAIMDEGDLNGDFTQLLGKEAVFSQGLRPVGEDQTGFYLAGTLTLEAGDERVVMSAASGVTSIRGKVIAFNVYGPGSTPADIAARLREAKGLVRAALAAN